MKKLIVVSLVALSLLVAGSAFAQLRVDARQDNQRARIDEGRARGQINGREARRLERQQRRITRHEARAQADGVVTRGEQRRLERHQNRASRGIARSRHNAR